MKRKLSKRIIKSSLLGLSLVASQSVLALDTDSANVDLTVGLYAEVTGLTNFTMLHTSGANYAGSDQFTLNANGSVRVTATSTTLNGTVVTPIVTINGGTGVLDTPANTLHSAVHSLEATAALEGANVLAAGNYTGVVTLTVSSL